MEAVVFMWVATSASQDFEVVKKRWGRALLSIKCCCFTVFEIWRDFNVLSYVACPRYPYIRVYRLYDITSTSLLQANPVTVVLSLTETLPIPLTYKSKLEWNRIYTLSCHSVVQMSKEMCSCGKNDGTDEVSPQCTNIWQKSSGMDNFVRCMTNLIITLSPVWNIQEFLYPSIWHHPNSELVNLVKLSKFCSFTSLRVLNAAWPSNWCSCKRWQLAGQKQTFIISYIAIFCVWTSPAHITVGMRSRSRNYCLSNPHYRV